MTEPVLAPNRVRPSQVIILGARMTQDVLDLVRDVEDGFAEAVHAEATTQERPLLQAFNLQTALDIQSAPPSILEVLLA